MFSKVTLKPDGWHVKLQEWVLGDVTEENYDELLG